MVNITGVRCLFTKMMSDTAYTNPTLKFLNYNLKFLALKVESKKLLNIKWDVTSLFFKEY